ncbi:MAG: hypothetical protein AAF229_12435 [Pseudomonadota bacterium]
MAIRKTFRKIRKPVGAVSSVLFLFWSAVAPAQDMLLGIASFPTRGFGSEKQSYPTRLIDLSGADKTHILDVSTAFEENVWTDLSPDGRRLVNYSFTPGELRVSFLLFDDFQKSGHMTVPVSGRSCSMQSHWYSSALDIDIALWTVCSGKPVNPESASTGRNVSFDVIGIDLDARTWVPITHAEFSDIRFGVVPYSILRGQNPARAVFAVPENGIAIKFGTALVRLAGVVCDESTARWVQRNEPATLAGNTKTLTLLLTTAERTDMPDGETNPGYRMTLRAYEKARSVWREETLDWYALPRIMGDWVVVRKTDSPSRTKDDGDITPGTPGTWRVYPDEHERWMGTGAYGGAYWFWKPSSGESFEVVMEGHDSEVIAIIDGRVYFRQGRRLQSAALGARGLESMETLWVDKAVPAINFLTTMQAEQLE